MNRNHFSIRFFKRMASWFVLAATCSASELWTVDNVPGEGVPGQRVVISYEGRTVAEFIHGEGQYKPYLALFNKDGKRLTNPGINDKGEAVGRFPHHRGIFIGWNKIESELGSDDLWHMRGTQMLVDSFEKGTVDANGAEIVANIRWVSQKRNDAQQGLLIEERRTIRVTREANRMVVDHHSELKAIRRLTLNGDLQHAGLHFRADAAVDEVREQTRYLWTPADLPPGNGRIVSDDLAWINFRFPLYGNWYSVTQLNHPANEFNELSWRDYGRFGFFRTAQMQAGEVLSFQGRFFIQELADIGDDSVLRDQATKDYNRYRKEVGEAVAGEPSQNLSARMEQDRVIIELNGNTFTEYRFGGEFKYPFFYPLIGPLSGESVTTWNTEPWPHHSSLFFSCDKVNGANYWGPLRNLPTGQIRTEWTEIAENSPERVVLLSRHIWQHPEKDADFRDVRRMVLTAPSATMRQIDFEITLEPLRDVRIDKTNHSLFSARMAPDLAVGGGGHLINAEGALNQANTFGKPSNWMAGYGKRDAGVEGLAIFPHPDNHGQEYTAPWFTRDYGFFSPTPMHWLPDGHIVFPKGEPITFRYRVLIFAGDHEQAELAKHYAAYVDQHK